MLQEKAMLANLTIHAWGGRKLDKTVTEAVEIANNAHDAGAFNKRLIEKHALLPITKLAGQIRAMHYERTLPWGDNGDRLLPSTMYLDYTQAMRKLRDAFAGLVTDFEVDYPKHVQSARVKLGNMYDPKDYPDVNSIRQRFGIDLSFLPVPSAADFRVDIGAEEIETIKTSITAQVMKQQEHAVKDLWKRLHDVVSKVDERLSDPEATFRDSLIDNVSAAITILRKLNLTNDYAFSHILDEAEHGLLVSPVRLRNDPVLRQLTAMSAREIMQKIPHVVIQ